MLKIVFFFNPHFIAKYYLLRDIKRILEKYSFTGKTLDVGCGQKPYKDLFKKSSYVGIDFKNFSQNTAFTQNTPDVFFDDTYKKNLILPFKRNSFNNTVSFQVLEHNKNPEKMIKELVRVTKSQGYILVSFPFMWGLHEKPNDFFRFTEYLIEDIFRENKCLVVEKHKQGSIASVVSILASDFLLELSHRSLFMYIPLMILYPIDLIWSYFCIVIDHILKSEDIFLNYLILFKKK